MVLAYKMGLESVEERLKFFKKNEFIYLEDIKVLKFEIQMKEIAITELRRKLEVAQKEKDGIQLIVEKLENASKSLNKLIDCQIVDNYKKGLGYENYNAVPPPYTWNFTPLKPYLSSTSLDEFADKTVVENKSSEEETKSVRKDALIIKEWVSDDEEENVNQPKIVKKTVRPSIVKKEFVKLDNKKRLLGKLLKKSKNVNTAKPKAVVNAIKGNNINVVKASACWVWKPKTKVIDHVSKHNSASITLKKFDYINAQGRSKVLDLEKTKTTQALKITSLKMRVKKLQKKQRSRTQAQKIIQEVADKEVNDKVQKAVEEVVKDKNTAKLIVDAAQVSAAGEVNAARIATNVIAATITTKEITLAQALMEIKTTKPKVKGIVLQEPSESITTTISSKKSQDKGKAIMIKEPMKHKKKKKIRLDEEAALRLQAKFNEEQRPAREKDHKEQEANIALIET
uniref:Uncharacterized protein n=1 Tax=Tanacetum cinerariifolium TaxID=118510 RepID=A0A6L2LY65_TANCI|nr:hypothetical protein [Tanacetum cinerariifolium]